MATKFPKETTATSSEKTATTTYTNDYGISSVLFLLSLLLLMKFCYFIHVSLLSLLSNFSCIRTQTCTHTYAWREKERDIFVVDAFFCCLFNVYFNVYAYRNTPNFKFTKISRRHRDTTTTTTKTWRAKQKL